MFARFSLGVVLASSFAAGVWFEDATAPKGERLVFLSVGQGDATLIMSGARTVLIDAGPRTDGFDAGERLVAPQLRAMGVRNIDCLVITHPDLDHVGGLRSLNERFRIGRVLVNAAFKDHLETLSALERARIRPSQVVWIEGVWSARVGEIGLVIAAPEFTIGMEANEGSLFVRADVAGASLLVTGDANSETETAMSGVWDWDVDVLKAGHHGSRFSTSSEWLRLTSPSTVVASCGRGNSYGHPARDMVARVDEYGAEFFSTDKHGTLVFHPQDGEWVPAR